MRQVSTCPLWNHCECLSHSQPQTRSLAPVPFRCCQDLRCTSIEIMIACLDLILNLTMHVDNYQVASIETVYRITNGFAMHRWFKGQFYINATKNLNYLDYKTNKAGGSTVSVGHRDWATVWAHAKVLAGWDDVPNP